MLGVAQGGRRLCPARPVAIRPSGSPSCSTRRGIAAPHAAAIAALAGTTRASCASTATGRTSRARTMPIPARADGGRPRLHHLHVGIDRRAQRRDGAASWRGAARLPHRLHRARWRRPVAQISNPSFDAATFEIWGALFNGARLVILRRDVTLDPRESSPLRHDGITALFVTTALFNAIVRAARGFRRHCARAVRWRSRHPHRGARVAVEASAADGCCMSTVRPRP